jgi:pimeloyl-ACP methyl ester carboxylesterase
MNMESRRKIKSWRSVLLMAGLMMGLAASSANATQRRCETVEVPVVFADVPGATIHGELCQPKFGPQPDTVEFLVHGSTHNSNYWDFPFKPKRYSHVEMALDAGYATFNIDRIGTGKSTKPASQLVRLDATVDSLHQIIQKLRDGTIGQFKKVVYFGSSLSSGYGWMIGSRYPGDVDAFVLAGLLHFTTQHWLDLISHHIVPANTDPVFADEGLDDGYVTTEHGWRSAFFINEDNTHVRVPEIDESLKGEVSSTLLFESAFALVINPDPETSPSRDIKVPVLITLGELDGTACNNDGIICTPENVLAKESPFYSQTPGRVLDAYIAPKTAHALPIHDSFVDTAAFINNWLRDHLGSN